MKQLTLHVLLFLSIVLIIQVAFEGADAAGRNQQRRVSTRKNTRPQRRRPSPRQETGPQVRPARRIRKSIDEKLYDVLEESEANMTSVYPRVKLNFAGRDPRKINRGIFMDGNLAVLPNGIRLTELDIALTDEQLKKVYPDGPNGRQRRAAISDSSDYWTNGIIPYVLHNTFWVSEMQLIREQMDVLEENWCVRFVERTGQPNYLSIYGYSSGCWSYVGMNGGPQELHLQWYGCLYDYIIQHELLHAAGLFHEQSRPDRDNYVTILWNNIQSGRENNFDKYTTSVINSRNIEYDYMSVMHYGPTAWSTNGQITIQTVDPDWQYLIGSAEHASFRDIWVVNEMYSCSAGCGAATCSQHSEAFLSDSCTCLCPTNELDPANPVPGVTDCQAVPPTTSSTTTSSTTTTVPPTTSSTTTSSTTTTPTTTTTTPTTTMTPTTTTTTETTTTTPTTTTTTPATTTTTPTTTTTTETTTTTPTTTTTTTTTAATTTTESCTNDSIWCGFIAFIGLCSTYGGICRESCQLC